MIILLNVFDNRPNFTSLLGHLGADTHVSVHYFYVNFGITMRRVSKICHLFSGSGELHLLAHLSHPLSRADPHSFSGDPDDLR